MRVVELPEGEPGGGPRFVLLESVREYALERLEASGQTVAARRRHAAYFLALAEEARAELRGPRPAAWAARLERDQDNVRAAVAWARGAGAAVVALRLVVALVPFWQLRGRLVEWRRWLTAALEHEGAAEAPPALRAWATFSAGFLAQLEGNLPTARALLEAAAAVRTDDSGERGWRGDALGHLSQVLLAQGEVALARARAEEGVALLRDRGHPRRLAMALARLAHVRAAGDAAAARLAFDEGIALLRRSGDAVLPLPLIWSARLHERQGDPTAARADYEAALAAARAGAHR